MGPAGVLAVLARHTRNRSVILLLVLGSLGLLGLFAHFAPGLGETSCLFLHFHMFLTNGPLFKPNPFLDIYPKNNYLHQDVKVSSCLFWHWKSAE